MEIAAQFMRFGIAGVLVNAAGYGVYLLLTHFTSLGPKVAMSLLYAVGVALSFTTNRLWVFANKGHVWPALRKFVAAHAMGYGINWLMLWILVDRLGYPHWIIQGIAILVVAAAMFVVMRLFVFAHPPASVPTRQARS